MLNIFIMHHKTIKDLVLDTKKRIDDLHSIVDVLLVQYKIASEFLHSKTDLRQPYVDQLQELNNDLNVLVQQHPAMSADKISTEVIDRIIEVATDN